MANIPVVRLVTEIGPSLDGSGRLVVRITGLRASPDALPPEKMARLEASIGMEYPLEELEPFLQANPGQPMDQTSWLSVFEPGDLNEILRRLAEGETP